jgi:integrase
MANLKLTDGLVEALEPDEGDTYAWDTALPRFGVRVTPAGARIYLIQYRPKVAPGAKPKTRRITIGQHDGELWNVTKARAAARKLLAPVDLGRDPFAEREAELQAQRDAQLAAVASERAAERREKETFAAQLDLYVERRLGRRRSAGEAERLLRHGPLAAWGPRHVAEVRRSDVAELLESIGQRSPAVARSTYAELRPFFAWCAERDLIAGSPCASITAPPRPEARDRVLSDDELRLIWLGAERLGFPFGHVLQLLMLTGQRRAEVAGMTWAELDLTAATWRIPAERAKNKQAHEIDLSPQALAVVNKVSQLGAHLFPARPNGEDGEAEHGVRGFSATKRKLDAVIEELRCRDAEEAGVEPPDESLTPWRIHDLRRTAATGMAAMGFPPHVVERVLNHVSGTQSGLVGVYQRHDYRKERKAALEAWGARVASIVAGRPQTSNVTRLRA